MSDIDGMRELWVAVILAFIEDTQAQLAAVRRGKSNIWIGNRPEAIFSESQILRKARLYLRSYDFQLIAAFVGLEAGDDQIISSIVGGVEGRIDRGRRVTHIRRKPSVIDLEAVA